jgi:hypothetical protein
MSLLCSWLISPAPSAALVAFLANEPMVVGRWDPIVVKKIVFGSLSAP